MKRKSVSDRKRVVEGRLGYDQNRYGAEDWFNCTDPNCPLRWDVWLENKNGKIPEDIHKARTDSRD